MGAAIGKKLLEQLAFADAHRQPVSLLRGLSGKFLVLVGVANRASAAGLDLVRPPQSPFR
jgi:hypothetical protein